MLEIGYGINELITLFSIGKIQSCKGEQTIEKEKNITHIHNERLRKH